MHHSKIIQTVHNRDMIQLELLQGANSLTQQNHSNCMQQGYDTAGAASRSKFTHTAKSFKLHATGISYSWSCFKEQIHSHSKIIQTACNRDIIQLELLQGANSLIFWSIYDYHLLLNESQLEFAHGKEVMPLPEPPAIKG